MLCNYKIAPFLLFSLIPFCASAQDEAYRGGSSDGADMVALLNNQLSFKGGSGNGYDKVEFIPEPFAFRGGPADGSDYSYTERENLSTKGGGGDGHDLAIIIPEPYAFRGGPADGHSSTMICPTIQWTGSSGSGWGVASNWNINAVPCNCNKVIIPSDASVFPAVNEGLFKIGHWMNDGDFNCEALRIETGAQLTTRINNFIENHGQIIIKGIMEVRNSDSNAFKNFSEIQIRTGGLLNFDNH